MNTFGNNNINAWGLLLVYSLAQGTYDVSIPGPSVERHFVNVHTRFNNNAACQIEWSSWFYDVRPQFGRGGVAVSSAPCNLNLPQATA